MPDEPVVPGDEDCHQSVTGKTVFNGSDGDDVLCGDSADNTINGGDGDDTILGRGGNDILTGDEEGQDGDDTLYGGAKAMTRLTAAMAETTCTATPETTRLKAGKATTCLTAAMAQIRLITATATDTITVDLNAGGEVEDDHSDDDTLRSIENVIGGPRAMMCSPVTMTITRSRAVRAMIPSTAVRAMIPSTAVRAEMGTVKGGEGNDTLVVGDDAIPFSLLKAGLTETPQGLKTLTGGDQPDRKRRRQRS